MMNRYVAEGIVSDVAKGLDVLHVSYDNQQRDRVVKSVYSLGGYKTLQWKTGLYLAHCHETDGKLEFITLDCLSRYRGRKSDVVVVGCGLTSAEMAEINLLVAKVDGGVIFL